MTNPIQRNTNTSLDFTLSIPNTFHSTQLPPLVDTLRMNQAAIPNAFFLSSFWEAIVNCFKSICSCFASSSSTTPHISPISSPLPLITPRTLAQISARDQFVWFYKAEENMFTSFLGNFHPCPIQLWGMQFACAEGAYQAAKAWPNRNLMAEFQNYNGDEAFNRGRSLSHNWTQAQATDWRNRNLQVMREVTYAKYTQNRDLQDLLLATGNAYLVEHLPVRGRDSFWGDNGDGTGQNWLGQILMETRARLGGAPPVRRNHQYNHFLLQAGRPRN